MRVLWPPLSPLLRRQHLSLTRRTCHPRWDWHIFHFLAALVPGAGEPQLTRLQRKGGEGRRKGFHGSVLDSLLEFLCPVSCIDF